MLGGIDEAARDVRRRSWKYLECSITCAASFCGRKQHTKAVRSSGSSSSSTRLGGGGKYLFGCAVLEKVERARGGDDGRVAERGRVDQRPRIVEQVIADQRVR